MQVTVRFKQIFPQDAIGAILRGDQAIIAGDTSKERTGG